MAWQVPLSKGLCAVVDAEDFERVRALKWSASVSNRCIYAVKRFARRRADGGRGSYGVSMHRFILDAPEGLVVDHINGDGLDNRRGNLRVCTVTENNRNRRRSNRRAVELNIRLAPKSGRFQVNVGGHRGTFDTIEEARQVRQAALMELGWFRPAVAGALIKETV